MTVAEPQLIEIETPDGPMSAHLWLPPTRTGPGLVLVQEIFGVSSYIRQRARDLAELGYVVCAPEVYWRLDTQQVDETRDDVLDQAMGLAQQVSWPDAVADVQLAVAHLRGRIEVSGGVGLIGFCFGGGLAFNVAAVEPVDALVSYYGSSLGSLTDLAGAVQAPSLHHFGLADAFIPAETIETVRLAVTAHGARFETYPGANHAFDNPSPAFYHPEASAAAWDTTTRFLGEHLPLG
ncbi:MAG TPA: dienelactone hydrolase family protein [Propionibacteriaceae bacterium]